MATGLVRICLPLIPVGYSRIRQSCNGSTAYSQALRQNLTLPLADPAAAAATFSLAPVTPASMLPLGRFLLFPTLDSLGRAPSWSFAPTCSMFSTFLIFSLWPRLPLPRTSSTLGVSADLRTVYQGESLSSKRGLASSRGLIAGGRSKRRPFRTLRLNA